MISTMSAHILMAEETCTYPKVRGRMQQESACGGGDGGGGFESGNENNSNDFTKTNRPTMHRKFKGSKLTFMRIRNKLFLNSESINKKLNFFSEKVTRLRMSYTGNDTLLTHSISFRSDGRRKEISRFSQLNDYDCIATEHVSYAFPFKLTKKGKTKIAKVNKNSDFLKNNFVEAERYFPCTDSSVCASLRDKSLDSVDNENFNQRHFSANLGVAQLALYFKINQLKSSRVRVRSLKVKSKAKPSVCVQETLRTSRDDLSVSSQVPPQSQKTRNIHIDISNCTSDTDPDHLLREGIESNPGPPTNTSKSSGRKRKRGFGNQPVQSDVQPISQTVSIYTRIPPVSLENNQVNICYMNSVLQVLYYMPEITERLDFCRLTDIGNPRSQLRALKSIFNEMSSLPVVVTANHFSMLKGIKNQWVLGAQQDACEFINDVIGNLYAKQNSTDANLISNCPYQNHSELYWLH